MNIVNTRSVAPSAGGILDFSILLTLCVNDALSGNSVCVEWAQAVHQRRVLASQKFLSMWGHHSVAEDRRRGRSLHRRVALLPYLLLLEEEQEVRGERQHAPIKAYVVLSCDCASGLWSGWSTSTLAWWCRPVKSVSCQLQTAAVWMKGRNLMTTWSTPRNLHCWGNSAPSLTRCWM